MGDTEDNPSGKRENTQQSIQLKMTAINQTSCWDEEHKGREEIQGKIRGATPQPRHPLSQLTRTTKEILKRLEQWLY